MWASRCRYDCARLGRAGLLAAVLLVIPAGAPRLASASQAAPAAQYSRADAETIRREARDILSQQRFKPGMTFWQWLASRLKSLLGDIEGPDLPGLGFVGTILSWVLRVVCLVALLAMIALLLRAFLRLLEGRGGPSAAPLRQQIRFEDSASYEQLRDRIAQLASSGRFREAISLMMPAMVRYMERLGILSFHQSKTNGDYAREYPSQRPGREGFGRFVRTFDSVVYGQAACGREDYSHVAGLMQQVCENVQG